MFGEEALHEWQSNTSEKQLLHKSKKNAGKNWQNQLFSRTLENNQRLETTEGYIIQENTG